LPPLTPLPRGPAAREREIRKSVIAYLIGPFLAPTGTARAQLGQAQMSALRRRLPLNVARGGPAFDRSPKAPRAQPHVFVPLMP